MVFDTEAAEMRQAAEERQGTIEYFMYVIWQLFETELLLFGYDVLVQSS